MELHFHGPFVAFDREDAQQRTAPDDDGAADPADGGSAAPLIGALVGLALLVAVALAVKSRTGGREPSADADE